MTYNILASTYATNDAYSYCPAWALDWDYRKHVILRELLSYDCDILTLQEVESDPFHLFFQPEMAKAGYDGIFLPKSRARTMEDWRAVDGCVTFWKRSRFSLAEKHTVEYQSLAMSKHKELTHDSEALSRLITKDNVALVVVLALRDAQAASAAAAAATAPGNNTPGSAANNANTPKKILSKPRGTPTHILVANTHIHWNPEFRDVKLLQTLLLLEQLSSLTAAKAKWHGAPILLAGDFNSPADSGCYEVLSSGQLRPRHPDLDPYNYGTISTHGAKHNLHISSAYAPIGEPAFTNYTGTFVGLLDYIWYSHDAYVPPATCAIYPLCSRFLRVCACVCRLAVSKVLQPIEEESVRVARMPNAFLPSDHISLLAEFYMKRH